ncbi:MAG: ABC transporter permease [Gemmatimonadota bacterium]|nr:ABC transporter permease [Gemmatimonadota bacterium]
MKASRLVTIAGKSILKNKMRTLLTMLGIIIGVGAVIALLSVGQGAGNAITQQIQGIGSNLVFVFPGQASASGIRMASGSAATLTLADAYALSDSTCCSAIAGVAPVYQRSAQVTGGGNNTNTNITGTTPSYERVRNWRVARGRFFDQRDLDAAARVVVIGKATGKTLFGNQDPIGQTIKINRIPFKIIGVMQEKGGASFFGGGQDDVIFMPITTAQQRLFGTSAQTAQGAPRVTTVFVSATDEKQMDKAMAQITQVLRQRHKIIYQQDDFTVLSQKDILGALNQITDVLTIFLASIAAISLLVGGIGIMNIMLVSVTERTREIGIRKAIGARRKDILLQFLIEAITLSVTGGVIGILFGSSIGLVVNATGVIQTVVAPSSVALAVGFSVAVGLFFGLYPAARAASLHPIDALRYE